VVIVAEAAENVKEIVVKLSDGEKLIIVMLADIMKEHEVESDIDPDFVTGAINDGQLWVLEAEYPGIFHGEDASPAVVKETGEIMSMCRVVEDAIAALDEGERETIGQMDRTVFVGFDANEEPHYGVAKAYIAKLNRFDEFSKRALNSHMPTLDGYRRMVREYHCRIERARRGLPLDDIKAILSARAWQA